ncbi:MAG: hypothetical protein AAFP69_13880 [Planctomycetota bacterium]
MLAVLVTISAAVGIVLRHKFLRLRAERDANRIEMLLDGIESTARLVQREMTEGQTFRLPVDSIPPPPGQEDALPKQTAQTMIELPHHQIVVQWNRDETSANSFLVTADYVRVVPEDDQRAPLMHLQRRVTLRSPVELD